MMASIAHRAARISDLEGLLRLIHAAYRGDVARGGWTHEADLLDGQRTDAAALIEALQDPRIAILVMEKAERLLGCVQITDQGGAPDRRTTYLGLLSVHPDVQAGGLGRQLIAAAEAEAEARFGARRIEMTVIKQRPELIAYYERRGYARTGAEAPFPLDDPRFGLPRRRDLVFVVLEKSLGRAGAQRRADPGDEGP